MFGCVFLFVCVCRVFHDFSVRSSRRKRSTHICCLAHGCLFTLTRYRDNTLQVNCWLGLLRCISLSSQCHACTHVSLAGMYNHTHMSRSSSKSMCALSSFFGLAPPLPSGCDPGRAPNLDSVLEAILYTYIDVWRIAAVQPERYNKDPASLQDPSRIHWMLH